MDLGKDYDWTFVTVALHPKKGPMDSWEHAASNGISVQFQFLAQGGQFAPKIRVAREFVEGGEMRAELGELATMKAKTWSRRGTNQKDAKAVNLCNNHRVWLY